ncbi:MAG: acyltransferase [Flavobacteriales bacterium]|nr:acyltransferase [Flavobacteriales bacterium]MCB0808073.1 acyltransferase [Flavobacteriales bacterium]
MPYYRQIDGIRAIAVIGPVVVHFWPRTVPPSPYTPAIAHIGSLGVDLFFAISGFLITGILLRSRTTVALGRNNLLSVLRSFYVRRSIRLFPIYYLSLLILAILGLQEIREHWTWYAFYLANFHMALTGQWPGALSHLWSLSVEEQFYLLWPFLILSLRDKWLPWVLLVAMLLAPLFRLLLSGIHAGPMSIAIITPCCLDPLCGGALLSYAFHAGRPERWWNWLRLAGGIGILGTGVMLTRYILDSTGGPVNGTMPLLRVFTTLTFTAIIGHADAERTGRLGRLLICRPMVGLGRISYGVYLYHPFVGWGLDHAVGKSQSPTVMMFVLVLVCTILVASLSWHLVERPISSLKHRFPYAHNRAIP